MEAGSLPAFQAQAVTCIDNVLQANGRIVISNFKPTHTYQYSAGSSFDAANVLSGVAKPVPADGVLVSTLTNPATTEAYTVRVYNSLACYTDVTVLLVPTVCSCPAEVCAVCLRANQAGQTHW